MKLELILKSIKFLKFLKTMKIKTKKYTNGKLLNHLTKSIAQIKYTGITLGVQSFIF
jgi:hypothetical protein